MLRQINIQLIDRIKKPSEGNRFLNGIMSVLMIILYPIILVIGIIIMVFVGIFAFFQNLFSKPDTELELETQSSDIEQWNILTNFSGINIYQKYISEIRFGPAYLNLKSEPKIEFLKNKLFGDWFFTYSNGILLQQWNSTEKPNTNLIFIGIDNIEVQVLEKNIPSVNWKIVETKNKTLELNCDTGKEVLTYKIEIKNVG
ncbi:hypothetical protein [Winogradskyella pulchriflava]|uniref:Uncharacterized protein n=1 Tax=Winogradskyella pulchriflava TaxID=1110688 RepID=A0ABV6QD85_9FLAO